MLPTPAFGSPTASFHTLLIKSSTELNSISFSQTWVKCLVHYAQSNPWKCWEQQACVGISRCLICLRIIFCHGCSLSLTLDSGLKDAASRPALAVGNSVSGAVTQCSAWMLSQPKRYVNSSLPDAAELPGLDWHSNSCKVISFIDYCGISLLLLKDKRMIAKRSLCFVWLEEAEFWTIQYIDCYHIQPFPLLSIFLPSDHTPRSMDLETVSV